MLSAHPTDRHDRPHSAEDIQRYKRHTHYIELSVLAGTVACMVLMVLTSPL